MLILNADRTAAILPFARLVPAVAEAALELASGALHAPERQVVPIDPASVLLSMPAIGRGIGAIKVITIHNDNARHGLPILQGEVIVFDSATGRRLAMLDGPTVTARRTAAVSLLGIEKLAPAKPSSVILIGAGVQAAAHVQALIEYFGVKRFWVATRNADGSRKFCEALRQHHEGVAAEAIDMAALAQDCPPADVILALTTSKSPVIPATIPPHMLAVGVGAFKPDMAELPPELLHARDIVVDHLVGAQHEAGDLQQAGIDWSKVRELSAVLKEGVAAGAAAPVLKTVGHAAWDLAAARVAAAELSG